MSPLHINIVLRENGLPSLSAPQLARLDQEPVLAARFARAMDWVGRDEFEREDTPDQIFASPRFDPSREFLRCLIAELSLQCPANSEELAQAQARLRCPVQEPAPVIGHAPWDCPRCGLPLGAAP